MKPMTAQTALSAGKTMMNEPKLSTLSASGSVMPKTAKATRYRWKTSMQTAANANQRADAPNARARAKPSTAATSQPSVPHANTVTNNTRYEPEKRGTDCANAQAASDINL